MSLTGAEVEATKPGTGTSRCCEAAVISFMASTGSMTSPQVPAPSQLAGLTTEPLMRLVMGAVLLLLMTSAVLDAAAITFAAVPADITAMYRNTQRDIHGKNGIALRGLETHLRATERHLPQSITQC